MEESKELQGFYKIFRSVIYISILMEFFEYAIDPAMLDHWGGILCDIHGRIKRWVIYNDGNLAYSKLATFLLICITCIGTRNKKKLEFNGRKQVLYPIIAGIGLIVLSVWLYGYPMETRLYSLRLNIWPLVPADRLVHRPDEAPRLRQSFSPHHVGPNGVRRRHQRIRPHPA